MVWRGRSRPGPHRYGDSALSEASLAGTMTTTTTPPSNACSGTSRPELNATDHLSLAMNMRLVGGSLLMLLAVVLLYGAARIVAPVRHLVGVLSGTISPSSGNLGVVAGEFLIYAALAGAALCCLWFGYKLLDRRKAASDSTDAE